MNKVDSNYKDATVIEYCDVLMNYVKKHNIHIQLEKLKIEQGRRRNTVPFATYIRK